MGYEVLEPSSDGVAFEDEAIGRLAGEGNYAIKMVEVIQRLENAPYEAPNKGTVACLSCRIHAD